MDSPDHSPGYVKRDGDDEEWEGNDKRKHRSSKSKKPGNGDESEGLDSSGRRRSYGERNESRKRSGGSGRTGSDEDDIDTRKELRSKQLKKKLEGSSLEQLSCCYKDSEIDSRHDCGDRVGSKGHGQIEESERRKSNSKFPEEDDPQIRSKNKDEKFHDMELEKTLDRDSKSSEKRDSSREKGHGFSEQARSSMRRWDESDANRKAEDSSHERSDLRSGNGFDSKHESTTEKSAAVRNDSSEGKSRGTDLNSDKEERRVDAERSKNKSRSEAREEDDRASPSTREDRSGREKNEKHRQQKTTSSRDIGERSLKADDDGTWIKARSAREKGDIRSRTPERSDKRHEELEHSEQDYERINDLKRKELEKDAYKDDRSKGRDDSWSDRNRDRESSKENWKRRQSGSFDKELKDGDAVYDRGRDWEFSRHGRERTDNERHHRSGNRKDGNRGEAVKTLSNFSNENYDVIEIQTKPYYGKPESGSNSGRRTEAVQQSDIKLVPNSEEWANPREDRSRRVDTHGSGPVGDDSKERYTDDGSSSIREQNSWRDDFDYQGGKGRGQKGAMSSRSGSQPPYGNQDSGSYGRAPLQGTKGNRPGRGGRGRPTGRDNQPVGLPLSMTGSPYGPLGMPPPGQMQPLNPSMSPAPGPPMSPGVFIQPFPPPVIWPGARDMNMLAVPPGLSPIPPGSSGPRFPPNMGNSPNSGMYFNQSGPGRGMPPNTGGPGFNAAGSIGRGTPDKPGGWVPPRSGGPPGKAPSRGEQNDYSQNFVDTGTRPQNFIRELELTNVVEDYPKLRELIQKKDEIVANSASVPMYYKCDLREFELSPEFFGTKFDVILVDPPWEEYVHRAPGVADHMDYWTFEEILNLKIEAIADTPSFIFLWVGDGVGLEQGRQCLKKWGFRRCEDICWVKTNKNAATPSLRHDSHTLFQHTKEHCLMGIKGTVRRSTDGHIIHANIDTDVIIAEEPPYGSTRKPEDMYKIVEHFSLGRRRLELFGEDHNIRSGWVTVGNGLSSSNFNSESYTRNFADKDGKVWLGGGGRNPPPEAPHLVVTTPDIESLRPKSPMKNQQQQQSSSISLTAATSSNRRPSGNLSQNPNALGMMNQENSGSNPSTPAPWAPPVTPEEKFFEMYGYGGQGNGDFLDFEAHRAMNMM